MVTNLRHQQELVNTEKALQNIFSGIDKRITNDILAMEIRQALHHLGEITREITADEIPWGMYFTFCIGK